MNKTQAEIDLEKQLDDEYLDNLAKEKGYVSHAHWLEANAHKQTNFEGKRHARVKLYDLPTEKARGTKKDF